MRAWLSFPVGKSVRGQQQSADWSCHSAAHWGRIGQLVGPMTGETRRPTLAPLCVCARSLVVGKLGLGEKHDEQSPVARAHKTPVRTARTAIACVKWPNGAQLAPLVNKVSGIITVAGQRASSHLLWLKRRPRAMMKLTDCNPPRIKGAEPPIIIHPLGLHHPGARLPSNERPIFLCVRSTVFLPRRIKRETNGEAAVIS